MVRFADPSNSSKTMLLIFAVLLIKPTNWDPGAPLGAGIGLRLAKLPGSNMVSSAAGKNRLPAANSLL